MARGTTIRISGSMTIGQVTSLMDALNSPAKREPAPLMSTTICAECEKVLSVAEVIESFCELCGPMTPKRVRR